MNENNDSRVTKMKDMPKDGTGDNSDEGEIAVFNLGDNVITIDREQFEQIKEATITYLEQPDCPFKDLKDTFIAELRAGSSHYTSSGTWLQASWRLNEENNILMLERVPERGKVMYFFVASLKKQSGYWRVTSISQRKMWSR